jgi:hypothetical protein
LCIYNLKINLLKYQIILNETLNLNKTNDVIQNKFTYIVFIQDVFDLYANKTKITFSIAYFKSDKLKRLM